MHLRLNPQTASALIAGLLLMAAAVNAILSETVQITLGRMTYQGDPLVRMRASVPDIGVFESFNVNDDNPFIPYHLRLTERAKVGQRRTEQASGRPIVKPVVKPGGVVLVKPKPAPPPLTFPRLNASAADAPRAMGMIGNAENTMLLVRQGEGGGLLPVPIGGTTNGWTLMAVEGGNQAVWEDPSGTRHTFPVGTGALADAQALATSGGGDQDAKDGKKKPEDAKKPDGAKKADDAKKTAKPKVEAKPTDGSRKAPTPEPAKEGRPRRTRAPETPTVK
jgi:hypothetical protein